MLSEDLEFWEGRFTDLSGPEASVDEQVACLQEIELGTCPDFIRSAQTNELHDLYCRGRALDQNKATSARRPIGQPETR